jgi:AsmA protein
MATRSLGRRIAIGLAAAAGALLVLVVGLVLALDSSAVGTRVVNAVLPKVSAALGREVTIRETDLGLFPATKVTLEGLSVAGRPGEPPLVESESLEAELALWPLLRSMGKTVEVRAFTLVKPSVNLVRAPDGSWSHEGLGEASAAEQEPPPDAAAADGGATQVAVRRIRVEDASIRVIDRTARTARTTRADGDDTGVALSDLDLDVTGAGPGLPFDLRLAAALASETQNLSATLSVARLPEKLPERPEDWPEVQGALAVGPLALDRLRALLPADLGAIVRGGAAKLDARVTTGGGPAGRAYVVDGAGELREVRLRGQPASGHFRAKATWSPAKPAAARVDVTELALRGPGVDLGGHVSVETAPMRAWFVVTGPLLDLDAVMGLLPEGGAEEPAPPGGELLPASTRAQVAASAARGTVAIAEVRGGRLTLSDVRAKVALSKGVLALETLDAKVFGGTVSAGGTEVALAEREPSWTLAAKLAGLDAGAALQAFSGAAPLQGKLSGRLDLTGRGTDWGKLKQALTGLAALTFAEGALTTTDLGDQVLGGLALALEKAGRGGAARRVAGAGGGETTFRDLAGSFDVKDGFLTARSPVRLVTPAGPLSLGGRIGLDGRLDLRGSAAVPKGALSAVAPARLPLPAALEVPLAIGGTLGAPTVSVQADAAVSGLVKGQVRQVAEGAREKARGEVEERGKEALKGVLDRFDRK